MSVNFQSVSYPIFGGVDTKIHGFVLGPPKLQEVINAYADESGALKRRFGRIGLTNTDSSAGTVSTWVACATYKERLVGFTASKLYEYGEASARWVDKGRCASWAGTTTRVRAGNPDNIRAVDSEIALGGGAIDMAVLGNYRCYAYDTYQMVGANVISRTAFNLTDATGTVYASDQTLATNATAGAASTLVSAVKVVAFGTRFYIVYWDVTTANSLKTFVIDTTSPATITTSLAGSAATTSAVLEPDGARFAVFDLTVNSTYGPFVAFRNTTANTVAWGFISTAGALTNSSTFDTTVADIESVSIAVAPGNALHGIVYSHNTNPSDYYALLRSFTGSAWSVIQSSTALETGMAASLNYRSHACIFDSSTVLRIYYNNITVAVAGLYQRTFNTAGAISSVEAQLVRSLLGSRPFVGADGAQYYWVMSGANAVINTRFLMTQAGVLAGMAHHGMATVSYVHLQYCVPHVVSNGAVSMYAAHGFVVPSLAAESAVTAMDEIAVDMDSSQSHVTREDGDVLLIPGTFVQQYDGVSCTEQGFLTVQNGPTIGAAEITNGAGSLTNAANTVYSYRVIPEWTNAQGVRERGTDNGATTTLAADWLAGDDTVTFVIGCIPWTLKRGTRNNIEWTVYRTLANPSASSPFFKVGTILNDPATDTVTFTDLMSDATAATQAQLYMGTGEVDNVATHGGSVVATGNGRVFVAGNAENPFKVMYSKEREPGQALAFNEALSFSVATDTGPITAIACHGQSVVVFTRDAVYTTGGDGFNNLGGRVNYPPPQLVTADGGARGPRGVARTPMGIVYQSLKGVMLYNQSLLQEYLGAPLEGLADPGDATGIAIIPALQQVRLSFAATTHVYDYYHRQWYVFTHESIGPTCVWRDDHTAVSGTNDTVEYDDASTWTDGGDSYAMTVTLGWTKFPATMQGNLRFRRVGLTGESLGAHYLMVKLSHDYSSTATQTLEETIAGAALLKKQYRIGRQIAMALEVTIRDATLDVYGADVVQATAGMSLNEVVLELGVRGHLATRRI